MVINKTLYIIGAGGHGKVVADIAKKNKYQNIYFLDDNCVGKIGDYQIVGTSNDIRRLCQENENACFFVAVGNNEIREKIYLMLKNIYATIPSLIHPSAVIDESVVIEEGTVVMANVVINASSKIGKGCIINTSASIDHDNVIADFVHISPGAHLAGTVTIGSCSWIGIGCNVINNISISNNVILGAGTTLISNVDKPGKYVGLPLRRLD